MNTAQRTGQVSQAATPDTDHFRLKWTRELYAPISASPISDGKTVYVATENGSVLAFDLLSGSRLWQWQGQGGIGSTPALSDGKLYFLDRSGAFTALNAKTGESLWQFHTEGERRFAAPGAYGQPPQNGPVPDPWDFWLSSPVVADGRVYFGSSDTHVYALNAVTGALVWKFRTDDLIHAAPAFSDGTVYIGTWGTRLYAIDAATGEEKWHFQGGRDTENYVFHGIVAAPAIDNDTVYIGARDGFVYALSTDTGLEKWRYDVEKSWVVPTLATDDHSLYFGTSDTGFFIALDKSTGKERFRANTRLWTYASAVLVGNVVFTGTMAGELYGFDRTSGKQVWYYQTPQGQADIDDLIEDSTGKLRGDKLFAPQVQLQGAVEGVRSLGSFISSPIWVSGHLVALSGTGQILVFSEDQTQKSEDDRR